MYPSLHSFYPHSPYTKRAPRERDAFVCVEPYAVTPREDMSLSLSKPIIISVPTKMTGTPI